MTQDANKFDIAGPIAISYSTTSFDGKPRFSYRDAGCDRQFSGDEIARVEDASLGAFVTVVLDAQPDNFVRSFTLAVPAVRTEDDSEVPFSTFGFETVARETIAGPPAGVQHSYATHQLSGTAQTVSF
jgi:hypothetical protein